MDLSSLIKDFLEYLEIERNVSQLTIRNYNHYLQRFLGFLAGSSLSPARNATHNVADELPLSIRSGFSNYTMNLSVSTVCFFPGMLMITGLTLKRVTQNYHLIALRSFPQILSEARYCGCCAGKN